MGLMTDGMDEAKADIAELRNALSGVLALCASNSDSNADILKRHGLRGFQVYHMAKTCLAKHDGISRSGCKMTPTEQAAYSKAQGGHDEAR